ncbi:MAG: GNAT family N-acetyltransferase [Rhodoferax sp.]|nr:GNAT family N-acetyltransferase [Rhodoferax sp.]
MSVGDAQGLEGLRGVAIDFTPARAQDLPALLRLIWTHGPNDWNWLPVEGVQAHLRDIAEGRAYAVLAWQSEILVGAATYCLTRQFSRYQAPDRANAQHGYVCEVVVARDQAGRGLGTTLLEKVIDRLTVTGACEVYIDRHEENAASAGMMRKTGFVEIDTFAEPVRRPHGSRRTTVCRRVLA